MTKKLLERIKKENKSVYLEIKTLQARYGKSNTKNEVIRAEICTYLKALQHLDFITETERKLLHCYITL